MFGRTRQFPPFFQGFGAYESSISWVNDILRPVSETVTKYYDLQYEQMHPEAQRLASSMPSPGGISPVYFIAGGLIAWYLLRDKKGQLTRRKLR